MKELLLIVIFLVVWFVVNKYVLPKLGVPT